MIEINLLPEEMRKQKKAYLDLDIEIGGKLKLIIGAIAVGILVLLLVILSMISYIRGRQISTLLTKEDIIALDKSRVEAVNKEISILQKKITTLNEITTRRFLWSIKLNELVDMVLPGIWFNRIYTDSKNRFIIEGSVISKRDSAIVSVGKFMKNIRENSSFFKDFDNIKLESVERKSISERDVVDFKIVLYLKAI